MFNLKIEAMTNDNFSQIYAKNYTKIVRYLCFKGIDNTEAEDLTQEVFMKALRLYESGGYNPEKSAISTWLYTIANSVIIDFHRTNRYGKNTTEITEFDDEETGTFFQFKDNSAKADNLINSKELRAKINKAFSGLNDKEQMVAYLYFKRECEYSEIEQLTGFPMGSVKSLILRAKEKLQTELTNVRFA